MQRRKQIRQAAYEQAKAEKQQNAAHKAHLKSLPSEERAEAQKAAKAEAKTAKAARKQELRAMPKDQRRAAKLQDKMTRKIKNRPRRALVWGAALMVVVLLAVQAAPFVGDIRKLMGAELTTNTAEGVAAREAAQQVAEKISDEGIVLLKNDDQLLPLTTPKINVFGHTAFNVRFGGSGSGGADQTRSVNLFDGLERQGIEYNQSLFDHMVDSGAKLSTATSNGLAQFKDMLSGNSAIEEPEIGYLTQDVVQAARDFSDTALVVFGNESGENADFELEQLQISDNQRALLDRVSEQFDNIIVVINSGNAMELGFLDEYPSIKSALWIGTPGPFGTVSLAKVLSGEVNPSGHLTDTYAYDLMSAPASVNFGDFKFENIEDRGFVKYDEGIYVGYRFYETYYQDNEAGYQKAVQFPFGYGQSFTTFDWAADDFQVSHETVSVEVTVTNSGDHAGKDVVQVYFSAPYTEGGIEKSAVELAGYAKTGVIEPGQSETVVVEFHVRDMASWDVAHGAYVLESGDYAVKVATDVHSTVSEFTHTIAADEVFTTDDTTNTALANRFEHATGDSTYLSRADWEGTYPDTSKLSFEASDEFVAALDQKVKPLDAPAPELGVDNGLKLSDLKGLPYADLKWDLFLEQFTYEELRDVFMKGAYTTTPVERLEVPSALFLDGPSGIMYLFGEFEAASYPTLVVVASTWNDLLAQEMGQAIADEAHAYGIQGWYAPGMNLHRTAFNGRNFEYYSEDPLLSGRMASTMVKAAQSKGMIAFMKHLAVNEQETNARSGIHVFTNEQAMRELYLKPFEMTVKEGGAKGAMTSYVHIGPKWTGGNTELLQDVLRKEWGFEGVVTTDAAMASFMDARVAVRSGNDIMLDPIPARNTKKFDESFEQDPAGMTVALRDRVHAIMWSIAQTDLVAE